MIKITAGIIRTNQKDALIFTSNGLRKCYDSSQSGVSCPPPHLTPEGGGMDAPPFFCPRTTLSGFSIAYVLAQTHRYCLSLT